ncbi:T-complex protein 10A homolog 2 isoform X1 [Canis lupus dingo]|uniref:T-complex protein 10A homolog 2 isoform X1 n=1 Tax=Canis lupus dingo TaxID=286419 RepID=UPI000DC699E5|nr:T-complex protein 10A homolog 2 isoform X1 [Canis lupus dingo]
MLAAEELEGLAEMGCPEDGGAGAHLEDTVVLPLSEKDGQVEQMLWLQQQVAGLHEAVRSQESQWAAAERQLQSRRDALAQQNLELRAGLKTSGPPWPGAGEAVTGTLGPRRKSDPLVSDGILAVPRGSITVKVDTQSPVPVVTFSLQEVSQSAFGKMLPLSADEEILVKHAGRRSHSATVTGQGQSSKHDPSSQLISKKIERTEAGEIRSCEDGDETLSRSLQDRSAMPPTRGMPSEERPAAFVDEQATHQSSQSLQKSSGWNSPVPAKDAEDVRLKEDSPAADKNGTRSLPCKGPEGGLLPPEHSDGSVHAPPGTVKPQNPPAEPGPSHMEAERKLEHKEGGTQHPDGMVVQGLGNGCDVIPLSKGTGKDRGAGGKATVLRYLNGDVKKILPDQRVIYYYADAQITRTTYPNGLEVVQFPNKQTEKHHPDGSKEIVLPDGTVKRLSDGREETVFPDGTVVHVERNGDRTIMLSNGQREIQTAGFERREYPDGTVKIVYCTGYQETRYASGCVKIRYEPGNMVLEGGRRLENKQHVGS